MLKRFTKFSRVAFSALICAALVCCVQFDQKTTLYPDGSGKLQIVLAMKSDLAELAAGEDDDPFEEFRNPLVLDESTDGFVGWSVPVEEEVDGWTRIRLTGYFEDIQAVKMFNERGDTTLGVEEEVSLSFDLEETDGIRTLAVHSDLMDEAPPGLFDSEDEDSEGKDLENSMMVMMKEMMSGIRIEIAVTVPGEIQKVNGLEKAGRTAQLVVDSDLLFGELGETPEEKEARKQMLQPEGARTVSWKAGETSGDELAAFKEELAAVKAEWLKRLAEAEVKDE